MIKRMKSRKGVSLTMMIFIGVALIMFVLLMFLYFGHTGLFQRAYKITDKLGITNIAGGVQQAEQDIAEGEQAKLTPQEQAAEEQVKRGIAAISAGIENCLKGSSCVCKIPLKQFPQGYVMRFVNDNANNKVYLSVFQIKQTSRYQSNLDQHFLGQTGVRFVPDSTHLFEKTQVCIVHDIAEEWRGTNIASVSISFPRAGYLQLVMDSDGKLKASNEATAFFAADANYEVYGQSGDQLNIYITKTSGKNFCFFGQRFSLLGTDKALLNKITCNEKEIW